MNDQYEIYDPERDNEPPRPKPGDDISADSMAAAEAKSRNCPFCGGGGGWMTIYHIRYTGEQVVAVFDGYAEKQTVMRTVAYCVCAAGRKMMAIHRDDRDAKEVFKKVTDGAEILAGRYREWTTEDPTLRDMPAAEIAGFPPKLRAQIERIARNTFEHAS